MASVEWRKIPTVLYPQEVLDKAFRRASKQSTLWRTLTSITGCENRWLEWFKQQVILSLKPC